MTNIATEESIVARVKPILINSPRPMGVTELGRLVLIDSSAIFRALSSHPHVLAVRGQGATMFSWRGA